MSTSGSVKRPRKDVDRNRTALLHAARTIIAARGPDVPLEEIARAAGVSRTTLYRHFNTREALAATVLEDNVREIEAYAQTVGTKSGGIRDLFDFVLELQQRDAGFSAVLSGSDIGLFAALSARTNAAFAPLVASGRADGTIHDGVDVPDFLMAFSMAVGVHSDAQTWGYPEATYRLRAMLHRALFND